jgi:type I restriction enzyme S subunit
MNKEWIELSKTLNKVIDYRGKTPKKLGFEWSETGYRALSALNVKTNGLENLDSIKYASEELYKKWMKEEIQRGDILLTSEAPAGQVMVWDSDEKIVLSQRLFALRLNSEYDNYFIKYFLQSDIGQKEINKNTTGSTVFGISAKMFDLIKVPKIKKERQVLIGKILKSLDAKIELNNKVNRELEAMAKTLYDYWFVLFDFPDANGRPYKSSGGKMVYNAELKREIPEGWEVKELGKLIDIQRGISYKSSDISGGGIPMISLNSFNLDGTYKAGGIKSYSGKYTDKQIAKSEDLLIAATDVTRNADIIGKAIMVPHYYKNDLVFSMDIAKIIPKKDISSPYLMMLFNSDHYHNYIKWYASGTIVLHLNMDGVKWYKAEIPPTDLIEKFDSFYLPIANRINETERQNEQLTALRDWLLPMLMNGQVTVKEAEEKLSMAAEPSEKYGN